MFSEILTFSHFRLQRLHLYFIKLAIAIKFITRYKIEHMSDRLTSHMSEWGPWMPDCIDNFDERETIFSDQETYKPKRFRSRNCYKVNSFGSTTADGLHVKMSENFFKIHYQTLTESASWKTSSTLNL